MTTTAPHTPSRSKLAWKALIRLLAGVVVLGGVFFLTAGTFVYWEAWLYLVALFVPILVLFLYLLNTAPDALERRLRMREKQQAQNVVLAMSWGWQVQRDRTAIWAMIQHSLFLMLMSLFAWG